MLTTKNRARIVTWQQQTKKFHSDHELVIKVFKTIETKVLLLNFIVIIIITQIQNERLIF